MFDLFLCPYYLEQILIITCTVCIFIMCLFSSVYLNDYTGNLHNNDYHLNEILLHLCIKQVELPRYGVMSSNMLIDMKPQKLHCWSRLIHFC